MGNDEVLVQETQAWLKKALHDLMAAKNALTSKPVLTDISVFHCQQVVEKALKGFLTFNLRTFRKTHNIEEIGEQCIQIDLTLKSVIDEVSLVTQYAWKFRYPGEFEEPSSEEAEATIKLAEKAYDAILQRLPDVTYPPER